MEVENLNHKLGTLAIQHLLDREDIYILTISFQVIYYESAFENILEYETSERRVIILGQSNHS